MASTFKSNLVKDGIRAGVGDGSQEVVVFATYAVTAALVVNDVIEMIPVPAGAVITRVTLGATDLDTGGSPAIVLDVGDGTTTDRLIDGATVGQAGGSSSSLTSTAFGYTYASADTIDVKVQVAPETGATSGTISLLVAYVLNR
jgi:hypothetical protein